MCSPGSREAPPRGKKRKVKRSSGYHWCLVQSPCTPVPKTPKWAAPVSSLLPIKCHLHFPLQVGRALQHPGSKKLLSMHRGVNKALLTLPQREGVLTSTSLVGFESQELKRKLLGKMAHEVPTLKFFGSRSHPHSTALRYLPCVFWFRSTRQLHLPHLHGSSLCPQTSPPAVFPP